MMESEDSSIQLPIKQDDRRKKLPKKWKFD